MDSVAFARQGTAPDFCAIKQWRAQWSYAHCLLHYLLARTNDSIYGPANFCELSRRSVY